MKLNEIAVDYKKKFQELVANGTLFHCTDVSRLNAVRKNGLRAGTYFGFNDKAWNGDLVLTVQGDKVSTAIYPDPEHMLEHPAILGKFKTVSFKSVTKKIDADKLFQMFFEVAEQEEWEGIPDGFWLYCSEPVPAKLITIDDPRL